jgi:uncharacterized protein YnzC (UPF0291/DUF896 family)
MKGKKRKKKQKTMTNNEKKKFSKLRKKICMKMKRKIIGLLITINVRIIHAGTNQRQDYAY